MARAKKKVRSHGRRIAAPKVPSPVGFVQRTKFSDLFEAVVRDYGVNGRKAPVTLKARWTHHLKPFFEAIAPESLSTDTIERYITWRLEQIAQKATINREMAVLKRMYSLAIRAGKLPSRPYIPYLTTANVRKGFLKDAQSGNLRRQ